MPATSLLPPITAIRMVWAMTGKFSNDVTSGESAILVDTALKDIAEQAKDDEKKYVTSAIATMNASLRSLDITYKGRQLNFKENEKLRLAYLDSVKESLSFGKKAKDFVQSVPTMTIGAAGGVTVGQALGASDFVLWGVGLILAASGYLVNLGIVRHARRKKQMLYIAQDYERGLYYDQYIFRVSLILKSLYLDLDRIHKNVFKERYPIDGSDVANIINEMLEGVRPSFCKYVHKHMIEKKITPELWSLCETGKSEMVIHCPHWKKEIAEPELHH